MDDTRVSDLGRMLKKLAELEGLRLMEHDGGVFFALDPYACRWAVHPIGPDGFYRSVELSVRDARFLTTAQDLVPDAFLNGILDQCRTALRSNLMPSVRLPAAGARRESVPERGYTPPTAPAEPSRALFREEEPERRSRVPDDDGGIGGVLVAGIVGLLESAIEGDSSSGSGYDGGGGESGGGGASGDW